MKELKEIFAIKQLVKAMVSDSLFWKINQIFKIFIYTVYFPRFLYHLWDNLIHKKNLI
jgi:hypothetical protein